MHATTLLHNHLRQRCPTLHAKRLQGLLTAAQTLTQQAQLTITDMGRALPGPTTAKHGIKRIDRLVGNTSLLVEKEAIYAAVSSWLLNGITEPIILVDWSDLSANQQWHLLRASVPIGGRSLTLYEQVHAQKEATTARIHKAFLKMLKALLPTGIRPIIVTDAGFRTPWFQAVESLGWSWVGRIRHRYYCQVDGDDRWLACKDLYQHADHRPRRLGRVKLAKSRHFTCTLFVYRKKKQGRIKASVFGKPLASKHSRKNAARAREPWLIAASQTLANRSARAIIGVYRKRMQIEESFRDLKSEAYGLGLSRSLTRAPQRLAVLLLLGALALVVLWLSGSTAIRCGHHTQYQSNTVHRRRVLSVITVGRLVMRRPGRGYTKAQLLSSFTQVAKECSTS